MYMYTGVQYMNNLRFFMVYSVISHAQLGTRTYVLKGARIETFIYSDYSTTTRYLPLASTLTPRTAKNDGNTTKNSQTVLSGSII